MTKLCGLSRVLRFGVHGECGTARSEQYPDLTGANTRRGEEPYPVKLTWASSPEAPTRSVRAPPICEESSSQEFLVELQRWRPSWPLRCVFSQRPSSSLLARPSSPAAPCPAPPPSPPLPFQAPCWCNPEQVRSPHCMCDRLLEFSFGAYFGEFENQKFVMGFDVGFGVLDQKFVMSFAVGFGALGMC